MHESAYEHDCPMVATLIVVGYNATIQYLVVQYFLKGPSTSAASMLIQTIIVISDLVLAMRTRSTVDSELLIVQLNHNAYTY